jgi:hydroxypyruvate isomerase
MMDCFEAAAKAGFKGIEFHYSYAWPGLPGREEEFHDFIGLAIDYTSALGSPLVHVMAGVLPGDFGRVRAMETFAYNLYFTATACAEEGIAVLIEPLNAEDVPGYLIGHTVQAKSLIDVVGHDNLFLQYDLYYWAMNGEDPLAAIEENLGRIRHMQVAGATGHHEAEDGGIDCGALF